MTESRATWLTLVIRISSLTLLTALGLVLFSAAIQFGLLGHDDTENGKLYGTLFVIAANAAVILAAAGVCGRGGRATPMIVSMLATGIAAAWWCIFVLYEGDMSWQMQTVTIRMANTFTLLGLVLLYHEGIGLIDSDASMVHAVRGLLRIGAWSFVGLVFLQVWVPEIFDALLSLTRLQSVFSMVMVLLVTSTFLGPALLKTLATRHKKAAGAGLGSLGAVLSLDLDCPQCQSPLSVAPGATRCRGCGFSMLIEIEEPRCVCGYLIYEDTSHQCPECGELIEPDLQWRSGSHPRSPPRHPPTSPIPVTGA